MSKPTGRQFYLNILSKGTLYMSRLTGKRVLITGGSSGIGQEIALAYAKKGAIVVFSYHQNTKGAEQTVAAIQALGEKAYAIKANMADKDSLQTLFQKTLSQLGGLDILVNNAGTLTRHPNFLDISPDDFEHIQAVYIRAPFILTQLAAIQMQVQKTGGSIINISSRSSTIITPGLAHYECSKAALDALTRSSASALAPYNIRVNAIAPGLVATEINRAQRENDYSAWEKRSAQIPLGKAGEPKDIATIAVLLASEKSSWMTGTIIPIDGGVGVISPFNVPPKPENLPLAKL